MPDRKTPCWWVPMVVGFMVSSVSAGLGHGDRFWAKVFFPYTMLSTLAFGVITYLFLVFACLQFPLYGVMISLAARASTRTGVFVVFVLGLFHLGSVVVCFVNLTGTFG